MSAPIHWRSRWMQQQLQKYQFRATVDPDLFHLNALFVSVTGMVSWRETISKQMRWMEFRFVIHRQIANQPVRFTGEIQMDTFNGFKVL